MARITPTDDGKPIYNIPQAEEELAQTGWQRLTLWLIKLRFFPITFDSLGKPYFKFLSLNTLIFFLVYLIGGGALFSIGRLWPPVNRLFNKPMEEMVFKLGRSPTDTVAMFLFQVCLLGAVLGTPHVIARAIPNNWELINWDGKCTKRITSRKPGMVANLILFDLTFILLFTIYFSYIIASSSEIIEAKIITIAMFICANICSKLVPVIGHFLATTWMENFMQITTNAAESSVGSIMEESLKCLKLY